MADVAPVLCRVDPFSKKDWYEVKAPSMFSSRNVGKTLVTRTQGTKVGLETFLKLAVSYLRVLLFLCIRMLPTACSQACNTF